jgi:HD-GYP domain-containing protein (c-di-GMP phosphodiesterase class II)
MTTNRPYQAAMDPEYVIRVINSLAETRFDPKVVAAMTAAFQRGEVPVRKVATASPEDALIPAEAAPAGAGLPS